MSSCGKQLVAFSSLFSSPPAIRVLLRTLRGRPEPNSQERKSNYQHSACTCREGVEAESSPGMSLGRMDPSDETTGVTDAGMDDLLLLGRLEPNPIIPILSAFNCRLLARNSR